MPGWARSTRVMCSACGPVSVAVASSQCSAIQRRRVIFVFVLHQILCAFGPCPSVPALTAAKNTEGTLCSVPSEFACGCWSRLLLLRGLLRGLLRRCFLGCLFRCHFPILPFRWVASKLQVELQLGECIDSCNTSVKKKTNREWKKWQQFFRMVFAGAGMIFR